MYMEDINKACQAWEVDKCMAPTSHTSNTKNSKNEDIRLNPLNFKGMYI